MAKIRTLFEPTYLYRYRSLGSYENWKRELATISKAYLWFSNFQSLNDPMEGTYEASVRFKNGERFQSTSERIFGEKLALGICSFSESNDHDLMWAHYADRFKGICIEYYLPKLLKALDDDIDLVRLSYLERRLRVTPRMATTDDIARKILSTKNHRWVYEREWRFISRTPGRQYLQNKDCISCVYIGNRISALRKDQLVRQLMSGGIRHKTMEIDGYTISFKSGLRSAPK